jgi:exopolysaccharide production protein ExoQ
MVTPEGFDYEAARIGVAPSSSIINRIAWLTFLAAGVVGCSKQLKMSKALISSNRYFVLFLTLAAASVLWSIDPGMTIMRLIRTVTVTSLCVAFAAGSRSPNSFQSIQQPFLLLITIGSIIFALSSPLYGIEQLDQFELRGAWKGLTTQKNTLGSVASIASMVWLHGLLSKRTKFAIGVLGLVTALTCVINSRSSTSLMATLFGTMLMLILMRSPGSFKRTMPYLVGVFVIIILIYSLAVLNLIPGSDALLGPIASMTGKDMTFSGRTAIWNVLNESIYTHKWLGGGYGAYWTGDNPDAPSAIMKARLYFYPSEAHNGYLDIINDIGWVGEFILLGYILTFVRQSLKLYTINRSQASLYLVLVFQQLIANLSESMWLNIRTIQFVIFTMATICLARDLRFATTPSPTMGRITEQTSATRNGTSAATPASQRRQYIQSAFDKLRNKKS